MGHLGTWLPEILDGSGVRHPAQFSCTLCGERIVGLYVPDLCPRAVERARERAALKQATPVSAGWSL